MLFLWVVFPVSGQVQSLCSDLSIQRVCRQMASLGLVCHSLVLEVRAVLFKVRSMCAQLEFGLRVHSPIHGVTILVSVLFVTAATPFGSLGLFFAVFEPETQDAMFLPPFGSGQRGNSNRIAPRTTARRRDAPSPFVFKAPPPHFGRILVGLPGGQRPKRSSGSPHPL